MPPLSIHDITAWPDSWIATISFYSSNVLDFLSIPPITLSIASSKSESETFSQLFQIVIIAASFTTFFISDPEKLGVKVANLFT